MSDEKRIRFDFMAPTEVRFGAGRLPEIGEAAKLGKKALLVSGRKFAKATGLLDKVRRALEREGAEVVEFAQVEPDPRFPTVEGGAEVCRAEGCDFVVAVGGGSAMDAAKAISVLATNDGRAADFVGVDKFDRDPLPLACVPTTAGTGSEVTRYSVLVDPETGLKRVIVSFRLLPKLAVLDPEVTLTLPRELTVSTGLDALCHAVEGLFSVNSSPLTDTLAIESVRTIWDALPKLVEALDDLELRTKMLYASLVAGYALNMTGTILAHGLGYTLTTDFGIPHGLASALMLPAVLERVAPSRPEKAQLLASALGVDVGQIPGTLREFLGRLGAPRNLREAGLGPEALPTLEAKAVPSCQRVAANTPGSYTLADYLEIYKRAMEGD